jgi:hypothetical protein
MRPPLWSSGLSSWLQIQRSHVRFQELPDFLRSSGSGMGSLSLESTIEELLGRYSSGFGLENREYSRGDPLPWPRETLYLQKLAPTWPTCRGRSVGIVRLRTENTGFCCCCCYCRIVELYGRLRRSRTYNPKCILSFGYKFTLCT